MAKQGSMILNYKKYLEDNDIFISYEIKEYLTHLSKREEEPMKLAVSGQFSSGKSTFLNAMLSDDILPSGNLPITSKITYIRYGEKIQLKLTYNNNREELVALDDISKYVNQQSTEQIKNLEHITLYYPQEILKSIVFVDTPGFNSPTQMDDETTEKILEDVDGILWLTNIGNAGKKSEIDVLAKYFQQYSQKSICIVNHKDDIGDDDEVNEFIDELKNDKNFAKYFADIIPISALQALNSRQKDQDVMIEKLVRKFASSMEKDLISHIKKESLLEVYEKIMKDDLSSLIKEYLKIKKSDKSENTALYEESNIQKVFNYIEKEIKPQAKNALEFSLRKEINSLNGEIAQHYKYLIDAISELEMILGQFNEFQKIEMNTLKQNAFKQVKKINRDIDNLVAEIANILYQSFYVTTKEEFVSDGETSFFTDTPTGDWIQYNVYNYNEEVANKALADETFKNVKEKLGTSLDELDKIIATDISNIENRLKKDIEHWKEKYVNLQDVSQENFYLQEIAFESFEIFSNDFENEVIIFKENIISSTWYVYNSLCDVNMLENASYSAAARFNESEKKPTYDDLLSNIKIVLGINYLKSYLDGEDSSLSSKITSLQNILNAISLDKKEFIQEPKKEWTNKYRLLGGN